MDIYANGRTRQNFSKKRMDRMEKEKIVVGMSGGVDSSVAAWLLKQQGYEVLGVTMRHFSKTDEIEDDAAKACAQLGIAWEAVDVRDAFCSTVMREFAQEYVGGRTPNPCVTCNREIKWKALLDYADQKGAFGIATGHYARIDRLPNGRLTVANAAFAQKDQTYALYRLTQEQLLRTRMPLGAYSKEEVRRMAADAGLLTAQKKDSQEICFIPDGDYASFIPAFLGKEQAGSAVLPGNFVDREGTVLGRHRGIVHYTIGQRKGLGLAMGHPVFVTQIRPDSREVVIGENEDLFTTKLTCSHINLMAEERLEGERRVLGRIRYGHKGTMCRIRPEGKDRWSCEFEEPVRAVTAGQSAVFYEDGHIFGGGIIEG